MTYSAIIKTIFPSKDGYTPETEPLNNQVLNNAGGYFYEIDDWKRLDRFLIIGSESGTYYVSNLNLTKENTAAINRLLDTDGIRVVDRVVELSVNNRIPKNDTALFALSMAASHTDVKVRRAALNALPQVARTGTHLLTFVDFVTHMRGWGSALRKAIGRWFLNMPVDKLCLQAVKYYNRKGWTLRDLLRLSHPVVQDDKTIALIDWIVHPDKEETIILARKLFPLLEGKYAVQQLSVLERRSLATANLIKEYNLPFEALPTESLNSKEVWDALLINMPMTAMIRNLAKMSVVGTLDPYTIETNKLVIDRLTDRDQLKAARIHPFQLLIALHTYAQGRGVLGSLTWTPVRPILEALNDAFDKSFVNVTPTNKRILIGIDVSGSMTASCIGSPVLNCKSAAAAIATLLIRTEPNTHLTAFDTVLYEVPVTNKDSLSYITNLLSRNGGGTNLSLTVQYALHHKHVVDAIIIVTDNEGWAGNRHAEQALTEYRRTINPKVKLIVIAMASNHGSIANPQDKLSFDICGFDANIPAIISEILNDI